MGSFDKAFCLAAYEQANATVMIINFNKSFGLNHENLV